MENFNLKGFVTLSLLDKEGNLKETREINNLVMNAGKASIAGLICADVGGTAFRYTAIGTGSTAPNVTQTALVSEYLRGSSSQTRITTSVANDTARLQTEFTLTSSVTIQESGIFANTGSATMLSRATFSAITGSSTDVIQTDWKVQVS